MSGFRLPGPIGDAVFSSNYTTPTLHIIGRNDVVVIEERSRQLVQASENARVEEHDGGMSVFTHLHLFLCPWPTVRLNSLFALLSGL